ncbi:hypothetical protein NLJ89_g7100 [Agrocybe chaxingu]|uniref:Uncharacterized protein n=1 Tax=Agrocybe chaxingu TaxID=84603 RepID=A0A9W8MVD3_9AGAR|nr:hypothetical protein NLJ89_g7100 [Agrocybe chaxingu]
MPAPAVYVLAVLGTVGAVIAFKEFVYDPHIVPALERWKAEYDARREARRRREAPVEVPMSETARSGANDGGSFSNDQDDNRNSASASGPSTWRSEFMRSGLLRRRGAGVQPAAHVTGRDVELESLVAPEVSEWRNATASGAAQDIGQGSSANLLDQSSHSINESIPYPALSPSHAPHHVLFDSSINSPLSMTPSSHASGLPSMPASPAPGTMSTATLPSGPDSGTPGRNTLETLQPSQSRSTPPSTPEPEVDSSRRTTPSPPPIFVSSVPLVPSPPPGRATSPLTPPLSTSTSPLSSPPTAVFVENATNEPPINEFALLTPASSPRIQNQQRDALSPLQLSVLPPSSGSRASSPNLTPTSPEASVSPINLLSAPVPVPATPNLQGFADNHASSTPTANQFQHPSYSIQQPVLSLSQSYPQELDYEQGLELLSPPSSRAESPFSMADYSPAANFRSFSPLGLNTNVRPESSLSRLSSVSATSDFSSVFSSPEMTHSPMRMGLGNESFDTLSPVMQARAFSGLGAADGAVTSPFADPVDYPHSLQASVSPQPARSQTSSAHSTTYLSLSGSDDDEDMKSTGPNSRADQLTDQGLGLVLFPTSASASAPTASSAIQPRSSGAQSRAQTGIKNHPQSDSEFSDLDFLSDAAGTESEAESEEGWSVAGSEEGPARASNANGAAGFDRNATIRARGGTPGWRR